jgi:hypothetical protein
VKALKDSTNHRLSLSDCNQPQALFQFWACPGLIKQQGYLMHRLWPHNVADRPRSGISLASRASPTGRAGCIPVCYAQYIIQSAISPETTLGVFHPIHPALSHEGHWLQERGNIWEQPFGPWKRARYGCQGGYKTRFGPFDTTSPLRLLQASSKTARNGCLPGSLNVGSFRISLKMDLFQTAKNGVLFPFPIDGQRHPRSPDPIQKGTLKTVDLGN